MNECEQLRERGCNSDAIKIYQQEIEEFFVPLQIVFDELKASTEPIQAHFLQRWISEKNAGTVHPKINVHVQPTQEISMAT